MSTIDIPAAPNPYNYYADQITLYGVKLNKGGMASLPFGGKVLDIQVRDKTKPEEPMKDEDVSIAAIYGYAFEGQCYRLDRPRLIVVEQDATDANGCGFETPYKMWSIRPSTRVMQISVDSDLAEKLVLDANLPGNRPPNTYGNNMALAHRNGKITRNYGSSGS